MSSAPATPRTHAKAWRNAVFVVFALNGVASASWMTRIPSVRDQLDISVTEIGFLFFALSAGALVGVTLSSHVVNAIGGRSTIVIAIAITSVGMLGVGAGTELIASYWVVLPAAALIGLGFGLCDVAMNIEGAATERVLGGTLMPLFHASWSIGTVAGAGIGSLAAFTHTGTGVHLSITAVVVMVGTVVAARWIPRIDIPVDGATTHTGVATGLALRERMAVWGNPRILLIGLIALGMTFTEGSANDWLALGFVDDRGLDNGQGALVFAIFTAAMTVGRIVGVPALNRFGRVRILRAASIAAALGIATVILVPIVPIAIVGVIVWGVGASLGFPVALSAAGDDPRTATAAVGAVSTIGYIAFLAGPPVLGVIGEHIGVLNALVVVLVLIVVTAFAVPAARPIVGAPAASTPGTVDR
ncbi:MAG TPA: MFS transporter [Pseudolysinimonas sp.]|nr:MFS transporter [Pseudolysinimonas sp.]